MSESVEYRDGVFVATGPTAAVTHDAAAGVATATALMVRPDDHLAPIDAPGPLASAELPLQVPSARSHRPHRLPAEPAGSPWPPSSPP